MIPAKVFNTTSETSDGQLRSEHLAELAASGITEDVAGEVGLRSVDADEAASIAGFHIGPALAFPYLDITAPDEAPILTRLKPDTPHSYADRKTGKAREMKYVSPQGSSNRLYVPPPVVHAGTLRDPTQRLVITEGEKKALAGAYAGDIATTGLSGVDNWRNKNGPIADLDQIVWSGREVVVMFDSDGVSNQNVARAGRELVRELRLREAIAVLGFCPPPQGDELDRHTKFGIDDLIVERGRQAFRDAVDSAARVGGWKTVAEARKEPQSEPDWLVDNLIQGGAAGVVCGEPKTYKSWVVLLLSLCVATGRRFLGHKVRQGRVAIVSEEMTQANLLARLDRLASGNHLPGGWDEHVCVYPRGQLRLDDDVGLSDFGAFLAQSEPSLIILDPLAQLHGADENSARDLGGVLNALRRTKDRNAPDAALLLVHHSRKRSDVPIRSGQQMRGSSVLHSWTDISLFTQSPDSKGWVRLEVEGRELAPEVSTLPVIRLQGAAGQPVEVAQLSPQDYATRRRGGNTLARLDADKKRIVDHLRTYGDTARKDLQTETGLSGNRFQSAMRDLLASGTVIERTGEPKGGKPPTLVSLVEIEEGVE